MLMELVPGGQLLQDKGIVISSQHNFSRSRLTYYVRLQGTVGLNVKVNTLNELPWGAAPDVHPLVPLACLSKVKERQQICMAVQVVENVGAIERDTPNVRTWVNDSFILQCCGERWFLGR